MEATMTHTYGKAMTGNRPNLPLLWITKHQEACARILSFLPKGKSSIALLSLKSISCLRHSNKKAPPTANILKMLPSTSMSQSHEVSLTRLKTTACGCRGWSSDGKTYSGYLCTLSPSSYSSCSPYASVASVCSRQVGSGHSSKLKQNPARRKIKPPNLWGFLAFCLQVSGACSHNCAKISTGAAKFHLGKPEPDPSLSACLAHRQHSPQEHPIEVIKAGENLPLSLTAKLAGGSEPCTCFLGLMLKCHVLLALSHGTGS